MTDIRARLADALRQVVDGPDPWGCGDLADALLSMTDIAVVELPAPRILYWPQTWTPHELSGDQLRDFAARLLAAAKAAEDPL